MTTEDNEDQEALNEGVRQLMKIAISDPGSQVPRGENYQEPIVNWQLRALLSALSEAGYTVVKTRYEYAGMYMHEGREDTRIRRIVGHWERLPESDTLRGGER